MAVKAVAGPCSVIQLFRIKMCQRQYLMMGFKIKGLFPAVPSRHEGGCWAGPARVSKAFDTPVWYLSQAAAASEIQHNCLPL